MNVLEERIRAAFQETAEDVPRHQLPPLRLPASRRGIRGAFRQPCGRRWSGWLMPLAAAAATCAVIAAAEGAALVLAGRPARQQPATLAGGIPPYYIVVASTFNRLGPPGTALLRATATGRLLATVRPPAGSEFVAVTAGTGERTFVLAAQWPAAAPPARSGPGGSGGAARSASGRAADLWPPTRKLRFLRLSVGSPAGPPRLAELPVRVHEPGADLTGLALTPDGSRLAISLTVGYRSVVQVFSLPSGQARMWSGTSAGRRQEGVPPGVDWIRNLSWAADDRTLAYDNEYEARLLDTAAPGASLPPDPVFPGATGGGMPKPDSGAQVTMLCSLGTNYPVMVRNSLLTPDGGQIIGIGSFVPLGHDIIAAIPRFLWHGGLTYPCPAAGLRAVRERLRPIRWGKLTGTVRWLYWTSPGGRTLIVVANFGLGGRGLVGVLRGNRFTPLRGTAGIPVAPVPPHPATAW
jgi:hypothetical protein